jgi:hypothetical protein
LRSDDEGREQTGDEPIKEAGLGEREAEPLHGGGWRVIASMTLPKMMPMPTPAPTAPRPPPTPRPMDLPALAISSVAARTVIRAMCTWGLLLD